MQFFFKNCKLQDYGVKHWNDSIAQEVSVGKTVLQGAQNKG